MGFKSLQDIDLAGKRVFVRADLNVPVKDGQVTDSTRIDRLKATIDHLRAEGAKVIVTSHFERPQGRDMNFSLGFLVPTLQKKWGVDIGFVEDCIGEPVQKAVDAMQDGDVILLENLRFHPGEEKNDPVFAKELAANADVYVNDAFSVSHRKAASLVGITEHLPSAAGLLMEEELNALNSALGKANKPVMAIVGGSKVSTKLAVLGNLVTKVDYLVLGGAMANTFLHATGKNVGGSMHEADMAEQARDIMKIAAQNNCEIVLPIDGVTVEVGKLAENAEHETILIDEGIPSGRSVVDAGVDSIDNINAIARKCKTVLMNGPLGVFELKPFDRGTNAVVQEVAKLTRSGQLASVGGGGDTVLALKNAGVIKDFSYVSSAGGAFLEFIEGKALPGVAALQTANFKQPSPAVPRPDSLS